ncbi:MAG: Rrf2 family transcriptional regulator [Chloroflexota bacterium]
MSYSLAFSQSLFLVLYVASKVEHGTYEFTPTLKISQDLNIPPSTAGMLLRRLIRVGLIESREGANGGVRLKLPPEQISVLDIFTAIEQERPLFQTNVQLNVSGEKVTKVQQTILATLGDAEQAMKHSLRTVTIRDLMKTVAQ